MNKSMHIALTAFPGLLLAGLLMSARPLDRPLEAAAPAPSAPLITVYPNPFGSYVNVQVANASNKPMVIAMRSATTGAVVLQQTVTYTGPVGFNTGALPAGGYLITVASTNGHVIGRAEARKQ